MPWHDDYFSGFPIRINPIFFRVRQETSIIQNVGWSVGVVVENVAEMYKIERRKNATIDRSLLHPLETIIS